VTAAGRGPAASLFFCIVKVATPPGGDCSSNSTAGRTGGDTTFQPVMRLAQPAVMPLFNRR